MSYYWFNRQELLQKSKEKYDNGCKEKAAKYYQDNKDVIKEKYSFVPNCRGGGVNLQIFWKKSLKFI